MQSGDTKLTQQEQEAIAGIKRLLPRVTISHKDKDEIVFTFSNEADASTYLNHIKTLEGSTKGISQDKENKAVLSIKDSSQKDLWTTFLKFFPEKAFNGEVTDDSVCQAACIMLDYARQRAKKLRPGGADKISAACKTAITLSSYIDTFLVSNLSAKTENADEWKLSKDEKTAAQEKESEYSTYAKKAGAAIKPQKQRLLAQQAADLERQRIEGAKQREEESKERQRKAEEERKEALKTTGKYKFDLVACELKDLGQRRDPNRTQGTIFSARLKITYHTEGYNEAETLNTEISIPLDRRGSIRVTNTMTDSEFVDESRRKQFEEQFFGPILDDFLKSLGIIPIDNRLEGGRILTMQDFDQIYEKMKLAEAARALLGQTTPALYSSTTSEDTSSQIVADTTKDKKPSTPKSQS